MASATLSPHRPRVRVPRFDTLPPAAARELGDYLENLERVLTERDRQLAGAAGVDPQAVVFDVLELGGFGDGVRDDSALVQSLIDLSALNVGGGVIHFPGGHTYLMASTLSIVSSNLTIIGDGWNTVLDFSPVGANGNGFNINIADVSTVFNIRIAELRLLGGAGAVGTAGHAIQPARLEGCIFDHLFFEDWSYGIEHAVGVTALARCIFSKNQFHPSITTIPLALGMDRCKFVENHDEAASLLGISERAGSDNNIFAGNEFSTVPSFIGVNTVCRVQANRGLSSSLTTTSLAGSQAPFTYTEMIHYTKSTGGGNSNYDFVNVIGTPGRKMALVITANSGGTPARTVTVRDIASSAQGAGGFQLKDGMNQVIGNTETWAFEFTLDSASTYWTELSRNRIV